MIIQLMTEMRNRGTIYLRYKLLEVLDTAGLDSLRSSWWQGSIVVVQKLLAVEWHKTLEDSVADTTSTDCSDDLAFQVEGISSNSGDFPVTPLDHLGRELARGLMGYRNETR